MPDFDKEQFERLMSYAVREHNAGQYKLALGVSTAAYELAPEGSSEKGRAARDNAARYDRLGQTEAAEQWAQTAYEIHNSLLEQMGYAPSREALREHSVTTMYLGTVGLRKVIATEKQKRGLVDLSPLQYFKKTWEDLQAAKKLAEPGINQKVDQYEINAARRVSLAESIMGSKSTGLKIGMRAVRLALLSESPKLDTSEPNLSTKERARSKVKALLGGFAALAVNVIYSQYPSHRQNIGLKLADKTL